MPIPKNYQAKAPLSAKERAFQQIQEWIIDGTLLPGEKINDMELAKAIQISRTPVREALQMLSQQGFVTMKPGVATYVNEDDPEAIQKILPPLSALQALAAEIATEHFTEKSLFELRAINGTFQCAIQKGDYFDALKEDERFHNLIVALCDNEYISNAISMMQAHIRRLFFRSEIILAEKSVWEHEQLICAFAQKNCAEASRIAKENWLRPISETQTTLYTSHNLRQEGRCETETVE